MSGVNSGIPLATTYGGPNATQNMLAVLQQNQQAAQENQLKQVFQSPDALDDTGLPTPNAIAQVMKINPNAGLKLTSNIAGIQNQRIVAEGKKADLNDNFRSSALDVGAAALSAYDDAVKAGIPEPEARQQAQRVYSDGFKTLSQSGYSPSLIGQLSPQFDPLRARANLAQDPRRVSLAEAARHNDVSEAQGNARLMIDKSKLDLSAQDRNGWQVLSDPNTKGPDGQPMPYRYNPRTAEATTLDGKPFTPQGAVKPSAAGPVDDTPMSDDAIKYAADVYRKTGNMPSFGNSRYAVADRKRIINEAAAAAKGEGGGAGSDLTTRAGIKADAASLAQTVRYRNQVESFEETAQNSAKLIRDLAPKGLGPSGVPVIDSWVQAGRRATGNADVVKFGNAIDTFTSEYAKIMSGATGAAGSTDSARQKAEGLINKAQNAEQLYGALDVMQKEMNIRRQSLIDQEAQITRELDAKTGGKGGGAAPSSGTAPPASATLKPPATESGHQVYPDVSKQEFDLLPSGAYFRKPGDAKVYQKP